jgi:hypothetical protein
MQSEKNNQEKKRSKISVKKIFIWTLFFLCVFFLILYFAVPAYLSSNSGESMILARVNALISGKVKIDTLSMGWFQGVKAQKFDFTDNTGCTKITAKSVSARPSYLALLSGKLSIDAAVIDQPQVLIDVSGPCAQKKIASSEKLLLSQETAAKTKKEPSAPPAAALLAIENIDLTINQGNFKVIAPDANDIVRTLELKDINSKLALRPLGSQSTFDVSMAVASANEVSQISASGQLKTANKEWSLAGTTGDVSLEVNDLDISALSPLFKVFDVNLTTAGRVKASMEAKIQKGQFENLQGTASATNLDISGSAIKGDRIQTSAFQADVKLNTTEKTINIDRLKITADGLTADVKGTVPKTMSSFEDFLKADSADNLQAQFDCDVAKTFKQVKTIAKFKEDFDINYGRLSGTINTEAQNGKRTLAGKVKLWALEGKFPVKRIILSKPVEVDAKIISQQDKITVEKLTVDSSFLKGSLSGTTDNMNYTARLDLAQMQSDVGQFFEIKPKLAGDANLTGKAAFAKEILSSTGSGTFNNIIVKMPDSNGISEPAANIKYDFTSDFGNKQITIKTADITASAGKISLKDSMVPFGSGAQNQTRINADMVVDLAKAGPYLYTFGKLDPKTRLAGTAQGDISLGIKDNIIDAIIKQIAIKNFSLASVGKQTFSQEYMDMAFTGRFDTAQKIYTIEKLQLTSPQIKLIGKLTNSQSGQNVKSEGAFTADYNLAAASALVSPFLPSGLSATGKRNDTLSFSSVYPKQTPALFTSNLNAKSTFGFDSAEYMGLNIGKSEFDIKVDNGLMTIAPFSTTVNSGKLNFAASANLKDTPSMLKTPSAMKMFDKIQITKQTSDAMLGYMNPVFAGAVNVTGILNFDCQKMAIPLQSGYKNSMDIAGTISIDNMHLKGSSLLPQIVQLTGGSSDPNITLLPTPFTVSNGIIKYDNMQMNIDQKAINFGGQIGLDKSMQMNVTLPWTYNGQRIMLPLKGTIDKPKIDVNKLLKQQAEQEMQQQIQKGLEKLLKK